MFDFTPTQILIPSRCKTSFQLASTNISKLISITHQRNPSSPKNMPSNCMIGFPRDCSSCNGQGRRRHQLVQLVRVTSCKTCGGTGWKTENITTTKCSCGSEATEYYYLDCTDCQGSGKVTKDPCGECFACDPAPAYMG
jgi:DnaJ-class molecular chaperone